jgi:peptidyl-prolyl cis-trans isomerase D
MLNSLRKAAKSWVAKLLLFLLVISFAVWGVSGSMLSGIGGQAVITAGGTVVTPVEFRLAYEREVSNLSRRFGNRLTQEQASALGVDSQVISQLAAGAVLDEQARKLDLGLSRDQLAELTAADPAFKGANGQFDRNMFERVLQSVGMRPQDYIHNREQVAKRQQIIEAISDGMKAPDTFLKAVALYQGESRDVDYVQIPPSAVGPVGDPSDKELQTFFDEHKQKYGAPEYRKIAYVKLDPEAIADPASIGKAAIEEYYNKHLAAYTTPEKRKIEQLVFKDKKAAEDARARLDAGATFEEVVATEGKKLEDTELGTLARDDVPDKPIADAAFSLPLNGTSNAVEGAFGPVLIHVSAIDPSVTKPLDEVSDSIRKNLALADASQALLDVHDSYEDARASGDTLEEATRKLNLKVTVIEAIDRSGKDPDGKDIANLPEAAKLLAGAFDTESGIENPPILLPSNGFVFYEVEGMTPARDRTLDEVRNEVTSDWRADNIDSLLSTKAGELKKKLDDGTSLDDIAAGLGVEKQVKRGLQRSTEDPDFGAGGTAAVFGGPKGHTGVVNAASGDSRILFEVADVFEPAGASAASLDEQTRNAYNEAIANDLLDELVARLQSEFGVQIDAAAVEQARRL